jgi:septum formation protein
LLDGFDVVPAHVDEDALTDPDPWVTAQRLAREKALAVFGLRPDALVIAGDTVVALDEGGTWRQLAKPFDGEDAKRMLRELAGRTHTVVTGVCLVWPGGMSAFTEASRVTFRGLSDAEIERYVATGSPMDKAGAYGLQDESQDFIEKVEGDVDNVIGLPVARLKEALQSVR